MQNIRVKQASLAGHLLAACVAVLIAGTARGEEPTDAEAAEKPLVGASDTGSPLTERSDSGSVRPSSTTRPPTKTWSSCGEYRVMAGGFRMAWTE